MDATETEAKPATARNWKGVNYPNKDADILSIPDFLEDIDHLRGEFQQLDSFFAAWENEQKFTAMRTELPN
jgi:hypothetical protein